MTEPDVEGAQAPEPEAPPSLLESLTPVAPDWADGEAAEARLAGWGTATGTLTEFARWVGSVRPIDAPFRRIRLVVFAADHGVPPTAPPVPTGSAPEATGVPVGGGAGTTAADTSAGLSAEDHLNLDAAQAAQAGAAHADAAQPSAAADGDAAAGASGAEAGADGAGADGAGGAGAAEARALLAGEGALALLAQRADVSIRLVDVGLVGEALPGDVSAHRVRAGSPPLNEHDPLTPAEVEAALDLGARIADEEVDGGADLVIPVVLTESALIPATVLIGALCGLEPVRALGYDAHVPDAVWIARCAAIRDGMHRVSQAAATLATRRLLAVGGGADLAAAAGFLVRSAARRTPALLDGVGTAAAALVARALAPDAPGWWFAPHASGRTGEKQAFASLRLRPVVDLGVRLGDGAGALLALPVLTAAIDLARTAPQPVQPVAEEPEVTVDPGDEIGGVGGYEAGARAPEPEPADATEAGPSATVAPGVAAARGATATEDGVPIAHPTEVDPAVVEPLDPADPLALPPDPSADLASGASPPLTTPPETDKTAATSRTPETAKHPGTPEHVGAAEQPRAAEQPGTGEQPGGGESTGGLTARRGGGAAPSGG